jgi:hypothetical protein
MAPRMTGSNIRAPRAEMPTLTDEAALEVARLASLRRTSRPPPPSASMEIEVEWEPEPEDVEPVERFAARLGSFARVPTLTVPFDQLAALSIDNRMGFLIAMVDGTSSIQTLLDVAAMPMLEVLRTLVTLEEQGIVEFRE